MREPTVTVSLVTFNGMRWLPGCLASIRAQETVGYELLVIDNASSDGSAEWLRALAAGDERMRLEESSTNLGFSVAHNRNIAVARGEFICLVNQDIELDPGFLRIAIAAFASGSRTGAVQGRVRRLGSDGTRTATLDTTGLVMRRDRRAVSRSHGEDDQEPPEPGAGPVFGADGAAPIYRREALLDARLPRRGGGWEVLDEDFFMYKEDVDLAWRLKLLGWSAWYAPEAVAWHARRSSGAAAGSLVKAARANLDNPSWIRALSWRNQRLMQVKNEAIGPYLRDLPWILAREVLFLGFLLVADPPRLAAVPSLFRALPGTMRKRRYLGRRLRQRRVSARSPAGERPLP